MAIPVRMAASGHAAAAAVVAVPELEPGERVGARKLVWVWVGCGREGFHTIDAQMLVAMNKLMPEPRPYPFWRSSSRRMMIRAATTS